MSESPTHIEKIRHSLAHVLAMAVLEKYPDAKLGIGPTIEHGFYYDFDLPGPLSEEDFKGLEKTMRRIINKNTAFGGKEITPDEAREMFADQPYKLDLIDQYSEEGRTLSAYTSGSFTDLCRGGHVDNTKEINADAFTLTKVAGAYWRGDENKPMLTRVYAVAFESKEELKEHLAMLEEAKKRDHKKLGKELGLFTFSETVGKGLPLYTEKGATIRRELERFIVDEELKRGYRHVYTPDIAKLDLYKKSGHYPHYKESMYAPIQIEDEEFMLRPMTCPHHFELYLSKPHSYRELPMRIAELAKLYRFEQSGELSGLIRVRSFCLADAHIICADEEQAVEEIGRALDLIEDIADVFGLKMGEHYWYRLSLGDRNDTEKYYDAPDSWDKGEGLLRELLKNRKCDFVEAEAEAAFYGPKIDIQMRNVNGKEDTAFTVQYDFCMPERFDLTYVDENGDDKRALVVHRSSIGAIERIMAFLIEHYAGAFPLWLSPVQAQVLPVTDKQEDYGKQIVKALQENGIRAEMTPVDETLGKRIRAGEKAKVPYLIIVGPKETETQTVSPRKRGEGDLGAMDMKKFIDQLKKEITEKK